MWTPEAISASVAAVTFVCTASVFLFRTSNRVIDGKIEAKLGPLTQQFIDHTYADALQFDQFEKSFRSVHARIGEVRTDTQYLRSRIDRALDTNAK